MTCLFNLQRQNPLYGEKKSCLETKSSHENYANKEVILCAQGNKRSFFMTQELHKKFH